MQLNVCGPVIVTPKNTGGRRDGVSNQARRYRSRLADVCDARGPCKQRKPCIFRLGAQRTMFEEMAFTAAAMLDRLRTETHLFGEFAAKLAKSHSVRDWNAMGRECSQHQLEFLRRDCDRMLRHGERLIEAASGLLDNALEPARQSVRSRRMLEYSASPDRRHICKVFQSISREWGEKRLLASRTGRHTQHLIDRAGSKKCRYQQYQSDDANPVPALNRQTVLERKSKQCQPHYDTQILVEYRHLPTWCTSVR